MAASDQTTFSGLTQLTAPSTSDRLVIEDASANETKYVAPTDLLKYGLASISAPAGTGAVIGGGGAISTWTTVDIFTTNGESSGSTPDYTNDSIQVLAEAGTYLLLYTLVAYADTANALASRLTADGTAIADSYAGQRIGTTGATGAVHVSGHSIFQASGTGETIRLQVNPSTSATVTGDSATLTCIRIG